MKPGIETAPPPGINPYFHRGHVRRRCFCLALRPALAAAGQIPSCSRMSVQRQGRPWPLKWIVLAILLTVVPYTFLRWHYRKPNPAFEPYQDIKDRANTSRLVSAGFQRVTLTADLPTEPLRNVAATPTSSAPGGLPATLDTTLISKPLLPVEILSVHAAGATNAMFAYPIELTCTLPDNKRQLSGAHLYLRDHDAVVVADYEPLNGGLLARTNKNLIRLTVPAGVLKPGRYDVTLVGSRASKAWTLEVR
jgi:hypothetical protein